MSLILEAKEKGEIHVLTKDTSFKGNEISKNTGMGCHFLLQCREGKSESQVAQSCLTRASWKLIGTWGTSNLMLFAFQEIHLKELIYKDRTKNDV